MMPDFIGTLNEFFYLTEKTTGHVTSPYLNLTFYGNQRAISRAPRYLIMDLSILTQLNVLLQLMCVFIVAAYLLTRSRIFPEILDGRVTIIDKIILGLLFGGLVFQPRLEGSGHLKERVTICWMDAPLLSSLDHAFRSRCRHVQSPVSLLCR